MKCEAKTEQEMREVATAWPQTAEELSEYIDSLVEREHDYGTSCYAMSLAATAAFNYVAHRIGATGFQASCADLDILRRTRDIKGPFVFIRGEHLLYPQYDLSSQLASAMNDLGVWAAKEAKKKLTEANEHVHPNVIAHWKKLAKEK
jgi:hypothetical protein